MILSASDLRSQGEVREAIFERRAGHG